MITNAWQRRDAECAKQARNSSRGLIGNGWERVHADLVRQLEASSGGREDIGFTMGGRSGSKEVEQSIPPLKEALSRAKAHIGDEEYSLANDLIDKALTVHKSPELLLLKAVACVRCAQFDDAQALTAQARELLPRGSPLEADCHEMRAQGPHRFRAARIMESVSSQLLAGRSSTGRFPANWKRP